MTKVDDKARVFYDLLLEAGVALTPPLHPDGTIVYLILSGDVPSADETRTECRYIARWYQVGSNVELRDAYKASGPLGLGMLIEKISNRSLEIHDSTGMRRKFPIPIKLPLSSILLSYAVADQEGWNEILNNQWEVGSHTDPQNSPL